MINRAAGAALVAAGLLSVLLFPLLVLACPRPGAQEAAPHPESIDHLLEIERSEA